MYSSVLTVTWSILALITVVFVRGSIRSTVLTVEVVNTGTIHSFVPSVEVLIGTIYSSVTK